MQLDNLTPKKTERRTIVIFDLINLLHYLKKMMRANTTTAIQRQFNPTTFFQGQILITHLEIIGNRYLK